ncbi:hypothetical protein CYCD_17330 [Tenuifilaceae bacterium CYCD]|nr:hypothetical protein CYCD_17330 [Tenuifilaceae bacterium CYCD]
MKVRFATIALFFLTLSALAQTPPRWYDANSRAFDFPKDEYFVGFSEGNIRANETEIDATNRIKKEASGLLVESIRLKIQSVAESYSKSEAVGNSEQISSQAQQMVKTSAEADIVGIKIESYVDKSKGTIAALAYVKKVELLSYYQNSISLSVQKVQGYINTALELEKTGAKAKARRQLEDAKPLLPKIEYEQDLLIAINPDYKSQYQDLTVNLRTELEKNLTRLEQSTFVYIKCSEDLFGKKSDLIASKLKANLASNGCSFTDDPMQADFCITMTATSRKHGDETADFKFCYVDLTIDMVNTHRQKSVYNDEISQKGVGIKYDIAARKASEDIVPKITEKILPWIKGL